MASTEMVDMQPKETTHLKHEESPAAKIEKKGSVMDMVLFTVFQACVITFYGVFTKYGDDVSGPTSGEQQISNYYPQYQDVHVMIFIGFGFLMTFLKKYGFSSVGYNFILSALTIECSILINGFWHNLLNNHWHKLVLDVQTLITGDFACGAVLISMGAVLGKASLTQLIVMALCELNFYALNESIGVIEMMAVDMGGSMYVHTFGAYFGLGVSLIITNKDKLKEAGERMGSTAATDMTAMIGTLFLWMFWPSFNGCLAQGNQQHRVVVNTVLALANSCLGAFYMSYMMRGKGRFCMVDIQNATLAGGVAVGSSSDLVIDPWGALLVGLLAGVVSVVGYTVIQPALESKLGLHDSCGVHNLHGMPGVMGGLGGAISAGIADSSIYGENLTLIFGGMAPTAMGGKGRTQGEQAVAQFCTVLITLGMSFGGGVVTGFIVKLFPAPEYYAEDDESWVEE